MIKFKGNIPGGWFVIRVEVEECRETLLGEIKYLDPDGPDLNVTFQSKSNWFKDFPEDLEAVKAFMHALMIDSSA